MSTYRAKRAKTLGGVEVDAITVTEMAERNLAVYKEDGVRVSREWDRHAPFVKHLGHGEWLIPHGDGYPMFLDHLYRLRLPSGRMVYGTEPYGVDGEDLQKLAALVDEGWHVRIGQMPLWYPGRTTQILISPEAR